MSEPPIQNLDRIDILSHRKDAGVDLVIKRRYPGNLDLLYARRDTEAVAANHICRFPASP